MKSSMMILPIQQVPDGDGQIKTAAIHEKTPLVSGV
jgi:hypothetical protein